MVNRRGQATTEFVVVLAIMTMIGIYLMKTMIGPHNSGGAVHSLESNAAKAILDDK